MVSFGHRLLFKYAGSARYTPRPISPQMLQKNQKGLNGSINFVQASPVCAILLVLSHVPGVPDDNRSAKLTVDAN